MNGHERQMLDILKRGRDEYGYVAVKAEYEAEGTRTDELLRLMEIARRADLGLGLKVGGCEAMRDLMEAKQIGVEYVIAPMIESPYALSKYIDAKNLVFTEEEQEDTQFLFNLETETAYQQFEGIIALAAAPKGADGVVFGRVDFTLSAGRSRDDVNSGFITDRCLTVAKMISDAGLDYVVGGGVSMDALEALRTIHRVYLSRFETRKVIFDSKSLEGLDLEKGLVQAVRFELLWLINKRNYYSAIEREDVVRIDMLERRWHVLNGDDRS